jgi:hypothetical protein
MHATRAHVTFVTCVASEANGLRLTYVYIIIYGMYRCSSGRCSGGRPGGAQGGLQLLRLRPLRHHLPRRAARRPGGAQLPVDGGAARPSPRLARHQLDKDGDGEIDVGEFIGRFVPVAGATVYAAVADMKARMAEFEGRENYLPTAAFGGRRVGYVFRTRYLGVGCGLAEGGAVAPCRATRRSVGNRSW